MQCVCYSDLRDPHGSQPSPLSASPSILAIPSTVPQYAKAYARASGVAETQRSPKPHAGGSNPPSPASVVPRRCNKSWLELGSYPGARRFDSYRRHCSNKLTLAYSSAAERLVVAQRVRGSNPRGPVHAVIAQQVERRGEDPEVAGSIPAHCADIRVADAEAAEALGCGPSTRRFESSPSPCSNTYAHLAQWTRRRITDPQIGVQLPEWAL